MTNRKMDTLKDQRKRQISSFMTMVICATLAYFVYDAISDWIDKPDHYRCRNGNIEVKFDEYDFWHMTNKECTE